METFKSLSEHFIQKAEAMCQDLLHGLEANVEINDLADDLLSSQPGFSFLDHPKNQLADEYIHLFYRLGTHHAHVPALSCGGRWNWSAVQQYLRLANQLVELLFGGLLTACGQTPRLTELANMELINTSTSVRNVFVWNGSVMYVIRHHKAKTMTNQEFNVVRFLPSRLGDVMIKYMVYIRPITRILQQEVLARTGQPVVLNSTQLLFEKNGKPWRTSLMTKILISTTTLVWNQPCNTRIYRQIAIGITEKHVRPVYTPFNQYDDRQNPDLSCVFAWQSGHRPLERGVTYGIDGAYPHQLQPASLRAYERVSMLWHIFIEQSSKPRAFYIDQSSKYTKDIFRFGTV